MSAAKSGSATVVKAILEKRGDPNIKDWKRNRAAHFAAAYGHFEVLAALAGYDADFDCANVEGNTALHLAARGNFTLCCRFLAQRGCNGKHKNSEGCTARMVAKEFGNKQAAKECKKGEKLHGKSGKGFEKFIIKFHDWVYVNMEKVKAALVKYDTHKNGVIPAVYLKRVLLSLEAPISYENLELISKPFEKAGSINAKDFLVGKKYLKKTFQQSSYLPKEKKPKRERPAKAGKFKLPMAICTNPSPRPTPNKQAPIDYIQYISCVTDTNRFDRDLPPNHPMQDDSFWYVQVPDISYININEAVRCNDEKSLKTAFEQGTPVDTKDKYFKTPLMVAASQGNVDLVKMLLEKRASVNTIDNFKWTPLHHACHGGQLEVVKVIVERGADINARALNGGTPLTRAIESSAFDVVQYLIEKGAKLTTETRKGLTPLDIATSFADPRVINAVIAKWTPPYDKFKKPAKAKKLKGPGDGRGADSRESPEDMAYFQKSRITVYQLAESILDNKVEPEDISYSPPRPWIQMPNTEQQMARKGALREQFGWKVDFPDFLMPFRKNVSEQGPKT
ncbi:ankyrin repeat and EF-hand domain-containing protein 1 [Octopus bimaculoides]|uniref:EF-hand domain-containing protein n=1 Tax=Octopus bimaculoides TaxID=37653 RepID=A0A0L8H4H8_OCTBM|nr:ankyrin repeat and EF-hand domain-containing protein 1 [Octopus bimaculoides]|eukprot:XP_014775602.1 PREDICTED: ankyrin repeat and EF-hand domain-containing protein 1-like [Octopus bimaculoides]